MKLYHFPSPNPQKIVTEKAGFSFDDFPNVRRYLDAVRSRPAWKETPKLPDFRAARRLERRVRKGVSKTYEGAKYEWSQSTSRHAQRRIYPNG
jgi:hypothetical protein